jgi:hypothetical protein
MKISNSNKFQLKMRVFWDIAPRSLVGVDRHFRGAFCLHHQGVEFQLFERLDSGNFSYSFFYEICYLSILLSDRIYFFFYLIVINMLSLTLAGSFTVGFLHPDGQLSVHYAPTRLVTETDRISKRMCFINKQCKGDSPKHKHWL